jgi:5-methyltetrahydropteroyltriglutamate--homocysteine methyltransferase
MISSITGTARNAPPFRYDIVGSFLRSDEIKAARGLFEQGDLTAAQLQEIENKEIAELLKQEKALGLKAVTDGEFRRSWWHLDFFLGIKGTQKISLNQGNGSKENAQRAESFKITGKIAFEDHPMIAHFTQLQQMAGDTMAKMTIPAPSLFHFVQDHNGNEIYPDQPTLYQDIITVYRAAIQGFYDAGCRYLQLDDTTWGTLSSGRHRAYLRSRGVDPEQLAKDYVHLINESIAGRPGDMTIALHVCRGNLRSTWFAAGGYEPVAEILFGEAQVDAFFLEYDNERSGDFTPLRFIRDQFVVLGLVTTKHGGLESKEQLKLRIAEAAQYVNIEKLCLSPQCGFASSEEGNILTEEEQWDKVRLVIETANEVWV